MRVSLNYEDGVAVLDMDPESERDRAVLIGLEQLNQDELARLYIRLPRREHSDGDVN